MSRTSPSRTICALIAATVIGGGALSPAVAADPFAEDTGLQPPECRVTGVTAIASGTRPDWSPDGRLIAYDAPVGDTYEVFLVEPRGANARCITCGGDVPLEIAGKHKGKATFHPAGRYLLFGAENQSGDHGLLTTPGLGENNDLWVMAVAGGAFWRLTSAPPGSALQYPRFSADGRRLLWSERYESGDVAQTGRELGLWRMRMADFVVTPSGPALANIVELAPGGPGFYEPHGFSPDGRKIIFTAAIDPAKSQFFGEIYTYDLAAGVLTALAGAAALHFEQALYSPSGRRISFMSGPFIGLVHFGYKTDMYLMDADGANRVRITHFNEDGYPESIGTDTLVDKNSWSPDGRALVLGTYLRERNEIAVRVLRFAGPCGALSPMAVHAAVLPASRSSEVGRPVTAFAIIVNPTSAAATACEISPVTSIPAAFLYQTTDPSTNALTGTPNTPATIPAGAAQTYMVAFTPAEPFPPTEVLLRFTCAGADQAPVVLGVNTLLLSATALPGPDVVALVATLTNDGTVHLPGATGVAAFAMATVNVGSGAAVTASVDTGDVSLPVALAICQSDPIGGQCVTDPGPAVSSTHIGAGQTPTFAVFVASTGPILFDPGINRIFVRFTDAGGVTRGSTSVAVRQ